MASHKKFCLILFCILCILCCAVIILKAETTVKILFIGNSFTNQGRIHLQTDREATPFEAEAHITTKGRHRGERVIIFYQNDIEYARSYPCCWGRHVNCNRTWIGMYCKALTDAISH